MAVLTSHWAQPRNMANQASAAGKFSLGRLTLSWMCCSAEKREQTLAMPAALTVAAGAALSSPLAAQAAVTPSLKNLINSVIAGVHAWWSMFLLSPACLQYACKSVCIISGVRCKVSWHLCHMQEHISFMVA